MKSFEKLKAKLSELFQLNQADLDFGIYRIMNARRLVEYLLSEECELALARSGSRQIPLGPVDRSRLPEEVRELWALVDEGYPLADLGRARTECLAWLKSEYLE